MQVAHHFVKRCADVPAVRLHATKVINKQDVPKCLVGEIPEVPQVRQDWLIVVGTIYKLRKDEQVHHEPGSFDRERSLRIYQHIALEAWVFRKVLGHGVQGVAQDDGQPARVPEQWCEYQHAHIQLTRGASHISLMMVAAVSKYGCVPRSKERTRVWGSVASHTSAEWPALNPISQMVWMLGESLHTSKNIFTCHNKPRGKE